MRNRRSTLFAVALFLAALPSAAASPVEGSFTSSGLFLANGDVDWHAPAISLYAQDDDAAVTLRAPVFHVEAVNVPYEVTVLHSPTGTRVERTEPLPEEPLWNATWRGSLAFLPGDGASWRMLSDTPDPFQVQQSGSSLEAAPVRTTFAADQDSRFSFSPTIAGRPLRVDARHVPVLGDAHAAWNVTGSTYGLFTGGTVVLSDGTEVVLRTGIDPDRSVMDPVTGSGREVHDRHVLIVTVEDPILQGTPTLAATGLDVEADGRVEWRGLRGDVRWNGTGLDPEQQQILMDGEVIAAGAVGQDTMHWSLTGSVTNVRVDGDWMEPAATAAGVVAAVGLFGLLLAFGGKELLTFVLGRATPQPAKVDPLGSESRRRILKTLHEIQPARRTELIEATGLSKNNVAYHVRILQSSDIIQEWRADDRSRNRTYMLNSGSLMFKTAGIARFLNEQPTNPSLIQPGKTLSVVNGHPLRRALFDAICRFPGIDYAGLKEVLVVHGSMSSLAQSTASHHLGLLEDAEAICSERVGKRRVYHPNIDEAGARSEQYRRYLEMSGDFGLVRTVIDASPASHAAIMQRLRDQGESPGPRKLHQRLQRLFHLGILEYDANGRTYGPASFIDHIKNEVFT